MQRNVVLREVKPVVFNLFTLFDEFYVVASTLDTWNPGLGPCSKGPKVPNLRNVSKFEIFSYPTNIMRALHYIDVTVTQMLHKLLLLAQFRVLPGSKRGSKGSKCTHF